MTSVHSSEERQPSLSCVADITEEKKGFVDSHGHSVMSASKPLLHDRKGEEMGGGTCTPGL